MHVTLYLKHFPPSGALLTDGTSTAVSGLAADALAHYRRLVA